MATHSSLLAWETPWTGEPGGLQAVGSQGADTSEHVQQSARTHTQYTDVSGPPLPGGKDTFVLKIKD